MSGWEIKRFWQEAIAQPVETGFAILLDGRPVKTPAKAALEVPTKALADAIVAEWQAVEELVDPTVMPFTRSANATIDKVAHQRAEIIDLIAAYGDADLLCYRADTPPELTERQAQMWDPLLDWSESNLGVRLEIHAGVIHKAQTDAVLCTLKQHIEKLDDWALTAFHDLVSLSGSLILGFAALNNTQPIGKLWDLSRLDELWQQEKWGVDEEVEEVASLKKQAFEHAHLFFQATRI